MIDDDDDDDDDDNDDDKEASGMRAIEAMEKKPRVKPVVENPDQVFERVLPE